MSRTSMMGLIGICLAASIAGSCGTILPQLPPPVAPKELTVLSILVDAPPEAIFLDESCADAIHETLRQDMLRHARRVFDAAGFQVVTASDAPHDLVAKLSLRVKNCIGTDHQHLTTRIWLEANGIEVALAETEDPGSHDPRNLAWTVEQNVRKLIETPRLHQLARRKAGESAPAPGTKTPPAEEQPPADGAPPPPPAAGCAKDTECKGDRICVDGRCVEAKR